MAGEKEGTVWLDHDGVTYTATWKLEHDTVLAEQLFREFLDGAKDRKPR